MIDLAAELAAPTWGRTRSAWPGYERNVGYGVMNLPFSGGDLLALRVFPRSDFGGYVSVWHRARAARSGAGEHRRGLDGTGTPARHDGRS